MEIEKFKKSDIDFHLKGSFKGLSKKYMMDCIFNASIQEKWKPQIGDIIVGCTGNIFVIGNIEKLHPDLEGERCYYGGSMCSRDGSSFMRETCCYTMNKSGKYIGWGEEGLEEQENPYHGSYSNYRFVPYPHEINRM
jgi:hypothetical protein